MGQQQLLLMVLVLMVVSASVAVGIQVFRSSAIESNRGNLISYCVSYGSKAQRYFRTSRQLGGGSRSFDNFNLSPIDTSNGYGSYAITTTQPSGTSKISGSVTAVTGTSGFLYVVASGTEIGNDRTNPVKAYVRVTADSLITTVLN